MDRVISLNSTLDSLSKPKKDRQKQNNSCNPKCIPLHLFPPVTPPLSNIAWLSLVKCLLQDDESIVPVVKLVDISIFNLQLPAFPGLCIDRQFPLLQNLDLFILEPFFDILVVLW